MKWLHAVALVALLLSGPATEALAACVNAKCPDSAATIEMARGMIQTTCGCTRDGQTRGKYQKCVKSTLKAANLTALIPQKACRMLIMKCENASICGRLNAAVCCVLKKNGTVKASIVGKAAKCKKGTAGDDALEERLAKPDDDELEFPDPEPNRPT